MTAVCVVVSLAVSSCSPTEPTSPDNGASAAVENPPERKAARILGFEIPNPIVPIREIRAGARRDQIPAILEPQFIPIDEVDYLDDADLVMGVRHNGIERAYPIPILRWHELVNDTLGGLDILVSYCPLCGTAMTFNRNLDGNTLTFGVSGLLYKSDLLMYDHQTESLWSQIESGAISGDYAGEHLEWIPSDHMTWKSWKLEYPDSEILVPPVTDRRIYKVNRYSEYNESPTAPHPMPQTRKEFAQKDWVLGSVVNGKPKAYAIEALAKREGRPLEDTVGGQKVRVTYDVDSQSARLVDIESGDEIASTKLYWFAWQAFYPETEVY